MNKTALIAAASLMVGPQTAVAQVSGEKTASGCVSTAEVDAQVSVEGKLVIASFTDDYGKERAYLLELPSPTCIDDGGEFADPRAQFALVQVAGSNSKLDGTLQKAVGRKVKVIGKAFAAHTRHHRAPMVVIVDKVSVTGR
jgi:hypothetical protein